MDNPRGRILSLIPGEGGLRVTVLVQDIPACPRCAAGKGCGAGIFATSGQEREIEVAVPDGLRPEVDDRVELSLAPDNLLRAAFIVYGLPMIGAIAGAAIAYAAALGDQGAAVLALLGLGGGLLLSRWRLRRAACLRRFTPRIERLC
ncbi:MAG: hypothetical protein GTO71_00895 [Woeseiaceae bacterium]|nr:hypothetical protein [Woeseiaceae bacterium]NIP19676.1 hypothetical protein [Woeseiaceae bacterium]NIS89793.1 hypothetical protein [Woeseiaceae bacterium]